MPKGVVLFGAAVGLNDSVLPNFTFDLTKPYAGCRLCGELYQSELDRTPPVADSIQNLRVIDEAARRRERWRELHTKRMHTEKEVELFAASGLTFTPEAANRLAPLGIIPMTDAVLNGEVASALLEAPRAPLNDVEGT